MMTHPFLEGECETHFGPVPHCFGQNFSKTVDQYFFRLIFIEPNIGGNIGG